MAFIALEERYRAILKAQLDDEDRSGLYQIALIEYMNHTVAAAEALHLDFLSGWKIPSHGDDISLNDYYRDFTGLVDRFNVRIQIQHAIGDHQFSVALDAADKTRIRHYADQIRVIIDGSPLPTPKKERLLDKLNSFVEELDRTRVPWDKFSDLVIGIAHLGGEAAKELEPARKLIDSISRLLGRAKEFEDSAPRLPPTSKPRELSAPKKRLSPPSPKSSPDLDDEIPL
jgi:hypothetical protein